MGMAIWSTGAGWGLQEEEKTVYTHCQLIRFSAIKCYHIVSEELTLEISFLEEENSIRKFIIKFSSSRAAMEFLGICHQSSNIPFRSGV